MIGQIEGALRTIPEGTETEIAFFGGSFTGIERGLMLRLLALATQYVEAGRVASIRLSTRPDMISDEILHILSQYPVKAVELGIQSADDRVLRACRRGHTAEQAREALLAVKAAGFDAVGQMMIGLPCASAESEIQTARLICEAGAVAARIYPTVVFRHTALEEMMQEERYRPLSTEEAVERSADVLELFLKNGVKCLRIGLCASEELTDASLAVAGVNHPALGELVWNALYYRKLYACLAEADLLGREVTLCVGRGEISKTVGQKRCNLIRLEKESHTVVRNIYEAEAEGVLSAMPWRRKTTKEKNERVSEITGNAGV